MPLYGGSIGGGYSNALAAMSQQNLQEQQLAEAVFRLQQQKAAQGAMGPAGASLYQWAGQQGQPQPPRPPVAPQGQPPVMPMQQGPMPQLGMSAGPGGAPAPIQPWKALPQPGQPSQPPGAGAPPPPPSGQADGGIASSSLVNAPNVMQLLKMMKANNVPEDQVVNVLGSIQPVFASEYKAAIGAANLAEKYYRDETSRNRSETYADDVASKTADRVVKQGQGQQRADAGTSRAATAADDSAERQRHNKENETLKQQELAYKKVADGARNQIARERNAISSSKAVSTQARDKFNAQIDADRQFITANPPGSDAAKNDFSYYTRVERAMTQKIGVADSDYPTWKSFKMKGDAGSGGILGAIRNAFPGSSKPAAAPSSDGWSITPVK